MTFLKQDSLHKQVAELLVVRASGHLYDSQREYPLWELSNDDLQACLGMGIGGVILFGGCTKELQHRCQTLREWAETPLLLCADIEEGVGQRFQGGTWLAPPMAVGRLYLQDPHNALLYAEQYGRCIGAQARRCGLNWVLAPVCDVNSNPSNPVINMRAWGEDPVAVSKLVCAFNKGVASEGVLTCAKHFPGHGDTAIDSHLQLPVVDHELARLELFEFLPFKAAISSGVSSVMTAHILLSKIDESYPATLSSKVLTKILREKIGFDGLLVTDALVMKAISDQFGSNEAALMAFEAGADLIMMPKDPLGAINAICEGLLSGRVPMQRLEEALSRREKALAKPKVLTNSSNFTLLIDNHASFESPEECAFSDDLLRRCIEIRNPSEIPHEQCGVNLLRFDGVFNSSFLSNTSPAICLPQKAGYEPVLCHKFGVSPWQDDDTEPLALERFGQGAFLLQLFLRGNPFQGSIDEKKRWLTVVKQLTRKDRLAGLIVYGSHYLWEELLQAMPSSIPTAYCPGQTPRAQSMVLSSLFSYLDFEKDCHLSTFVQFMD